MTRKEDKINKFLKLLLSLYGIYSDLRGSIVSNGFFKDMRYIEIENGQYLKISDCKIIIE